MVKLRVQLNHCFLKFMWWSNFVSNWITAFSSACDGQTASPVESLLSQVPMMVRLRVHLMVKLRVQLNHCFLKCLWWLNFVSSWITTFSSACDGQTMCSVDGQTSCPVDSLQVPVMVRLRVQLMVKLRVQLNHCFLKFLQWSNFAPNQNTPFSVQVAPTSAGDTRVVLDHQNWSIQVSVTFHTNNSNACNAFRETGLYRSVWYSIQ